MPNITLSADLCTEFMDTEANQYDFELIGYTGKVMTQGGWNGIFNIDGMGAKNGKVVILREHERDRIVGYGDTFSDDRGFGVRGKFSKTSKDGVEVVGLLTEGVPLQCSVGITPITKRVAVAGDVINNINPPEGTEIWEESYVGEISICTWGVDMDTSIQKFAKEIDMTDQINENELEETQEMAEESTAIDSLPEAIQLTEDVGTFEQEDIAAAIAKERERIGSIFAAGAPMELAQKAIIDGMSTGEAYQLFWESDKESKQSKLTELSKNAPRIQTEKALAEDVTDQELSYMELISKVKQEEKLSSVDATKFVMKNYPEAYTKFMGR